jgi:hypothetical protein
MNPVTAVLIAVLLGVATLFWYERRERLRLPHSSGFSGTAAQARIDSPLR